MNADALLVPCIPALVDGYAAALYDGQTPDTLAALFSEALDTADVPASEVAVAVTVVHRADLQATLDEGDEDSVRELAAMLRDWTAPAPGYFPAVICVGDVVGIRPLRLSHGASEGRR